MEDDKVFIKSPTAKAAKSKVYKFLLKYNGDKSLVPNLTVKPISLRNVEASLKEDRIAPLDLVIKDLGKGKPIVNFGSNE